ncbi:hypothetical protein SNE40_011614 [Patella caerulea]|uniref:tRNA selenocysteine-associated protein 1 n=1 Tax=Patella caerulea TaxID=87958 RepID=A0AAN8JSE7_PATCE
MSDKIEEYSDRRSCRSSHHYRQEYSLYIGDLSSGVDDDMLYNAFAAYRSLRSAKVVLDSNGKSKCYGFVRFLEETDQQKALIEMQHMVIGRRAVRVSLAGPKRMEVPGINNTHYNPHYNGQNQYMWGGYTVSFNSNPKLMEYYGQYDPQFEDDLEKLEDPQLEVDVEKENREFMLSSEQFFNAMDQSRWHPLDHVTSQLRPGPS